MDYGEIQLVEGGKISENICYSITYHDQITFNNQTWGGWGGGIKCPQFGFYCF